MKLIIVRCHCGHTYRTDSEKIIAKCPKCSQPEGLQSARRRYVGTVALNANKSCCFGKNSSISKENK